MTRRSGLARVADSGRAWRRFRTRTARRLRVAPAPMPPPFDRAWPPLGAGIPRSVRWPLNTARGYQARLSWPLFRPFCRLGMRSRSLVGQAAGQILYGSWVLVTALMALAATVVALACLVLIWAPTATVRWAGSAVLVWRGWRPPAGLSSDLLDVADLVELMGSLPPAPAEPNRSALASPADVGPEFAQQERLIHELRRANDLAERDQADRRRHDP